MTKTCEAGRTVLSWSRAVWIGVGLMGFAIHSLPAQAVELAFPLACTPDRDCVIQNYVHVGGDAALDYRCGPRSYDTHKGTDFRILDRATMAKGVPVLAAAGGTVEGTRDGVEDVDIRTIDRSTIKGRECGNGVVIDHGNGWSTQYCHLKKGSVAVRQGQDVKTGAHLGLVGLSGNTAFPHLHLVVRKGDTVIDPFTAKPQSAACATEAPTNDLWRDDVSLPYHSAQIFASGFAADTPSLGGINQDTRSQEQISSASPTLFLWTRVLGLQPRHTLHLEVTGPDGARVLESTVDPVDRPKAQWVSWSGKRRPAEGWPAGPYTGTVTLREGDQVLMRDTRRMQIVP